MEHIEENLVFEDDTLEDVVTLKEGLDLRDLQHGDGAVFEVDEDGLVENTENIQVQEKKYFSNETKLAVYSSVAECGDSGDDDSDEENGLSPFQALSRNMQDLTPPEGSVLKQILKPGTGDVVPKEAYVQVHYNAFQEYSGEPFDSTRLRDKPNHFQLGKGETIMGLDLAVSSMKKGEMSRFLISYKYAYGERGCPPRIGEKANVMFEIELLNFSDKGAADAYYQKTAEERRNAPFSEVIRIVKDERQKASELFNKGKYRDALRKYKRIIDTLEKVHLQNDEDEKEQQDLLVKIYLFSANCNTKLCHNEDAIRDCKAVLEREGNNVTALYFYAKALYQSGKFDGALNWIKRAQKRSPNSPLINNLLSKINDDKIRFRQLEMDTCRRMFSQPGSRNVAGEAQRKDNEPPTDSLARGNSLEEFKRAARKKMEKFKNNPLIEEMPFTVGSFSKEEIACVLEIAAELGLIRDIKEKGGIVSIKFLKNKDVSSTGNTEQ